jgi:hypothetical protein
MPPYSEGRCDDRIEGKRRLIRGRRVGKELHMMALCTSITDQTAASVPAQLGSVVCTTELRVKARAMETIHALPSTSQRTRNYLCSKGDSGEWRAGMVPSD